MAYIKVSTTSNVFATMRYGDHEKSVLRGGVDCPAETENAIKYFALDRIKWRKNKGVQAHIIIQSFKGKECSPQTANEIGQELVRRLAPGHRAIIYTHNEGDNVHNHIVISAVNHLNGTKLNGHAMLYKARAKSNEITDEYGLSKINLDKETGLSADKFISFRYTLQEREIKKKRKAILWKDEIRCIIDKAIEYAKNEEDFKKYLEKNNIQINERKRKKDNVIFWTFMYKNNENRTVRGSKLGDNYKREIILEDIQNKEIELNNIFRVMEEGRIIKDREKYREKLIQKIISDTNDISRTEKIIRTYVRDGVRTYLRCYDKNIKTQVMPKIQKSCAVFGRLGFSPKELKTMFAEEGETIKGELKKLGRDSLNLELNWDLLSDFERADMYYKQQSGRDV